MNYVLSPGLAVYTILMEKSSPPILCDSCLIGNYNLAGENVSIYTKQLTQ